MFHFCISDITKGTDANISAPSGYINTVLCYWIIQGCWMLKIFNKLNDMFDVVPICTNRKNSFNIHWTIRATESMFTQCYNAK